MEFERRKKRKYVGAEKFVEKMKEIQEEAKAVLGKVQEDMKIHYYHFFWSFELYPISVSI